MEEIMSRALVVYYSQSGATQQLAREIVQATGWDVDPIVAAVDDSGLRGFVRCALEARLHRLAAIEPSVMDPADYDLVVIGSPACGSSVSSPVRTYLTRHATFLPDVAFFLTCGSHADHHVVDQMTRLAGKEPLSTLVLTEGQVGRPTQHPAITRFIADLQQELAWPDSDSASAPCAGTPAPAIPAPAH
jgi:menaquinone-dependent protoporphyrinogen IX oxidase